VARSPPSQPRATNAGPAPCAQKAPARLPAERWSPARRELAPADATTIVLCRYSGLNGNPPVTLQHARMLRAPSLVRKLVAGIGYPRAFGPRLLTQLKRLIAA
jgi:hypothetical protein